MCKARKISALIVLSFTILLLMGGISTNSDINSKTIENSNVKGATVKYVYSKSKINIKKKKSASSKNLATVKTNTKLTKISTSGNWIKVKYKGKTGYVKKNQISNSKTKSTSVKASYNQKEAKKVLSLINKERKKKGLSSLKWNNTLESAAKTRAAEASLKWAHTRPDGSDWYTVCNDTYGENLAKNFSSSKDVVKAWMKSASHKDNILYSKFKTVGVSLVKINNVYYWAQEFGY